MQTDILIIKVGTNVLANTFGKRQKLCKTSFRNIASDIRKLQKAGYGIILVSSAAITAGAIEDNVERHSINNTVEEQRLAARGWDIIVQQWKKSLSQKRVSSALITKQDLSATRTRKKLLNVIDCCLKYRDIFLVNENDCLTDDEIRFGDNDILAATLAATIAEHGNYSSTKLVILTNKPGLNRIAEDDKTLIREVRRIEEVEKYVTDLENSHSRGGMISKLMAAQIATSAKVATFIASGRAISPASRALSRKSGTYFKV